MSGITLSQAEAQLAAYLAAETAVLSGQSYQFKGRSLTRADLEMIQVGINAWDQRVKELTAKSSGRGRSATINPGW